MVAIRDEAWVFVKTMRYFSAIVHAVPACGLVLLLGCRDEASILARNVESGETLESLAGKSSTRVMLLYAPSDVFACYGALQPWLDWRGRHRGTVVLVFTRPPRSAELKQLASVRVEPDATLRVRLLDRVAPPRSPREWLLANGRVVESASIAPRTLETPLYRRVRSGGLRLGAGRASPARPPAGTVPTSAPTTP